MKRYFVSAVALGAALGFAAPAWAQSEIGGQPISPEDLPLVEAHCQALWDTQGAAVFDAAPEGDLLVSSIDLAAITYEDCEAAGFFINAGIEPLPAEPVDWPDDGSDDDGGNDDDDDGDEEDEYGKNENENDDTDE